MILTIKVIFVKVKDRKSKEQKRLKGCFRELMVGENQDRNFITKMENKGIFLIF